MPDAELFRLAGEHRLRANLQAQVDRMLADPRSSEFFRNFVGQWLQARDIETVVDQRVRRDRPRRSRRTPRRRSAGRGSGSSTASRPRNSPRPRRRSCETARRSFFGSFRRFREFDLTRDLRRAMRRETEMHFEHVVREDRALLELLDCDYTFLNERLAKYYGIEGVRGDQMRRVTLPAGSPRGGILTQGTVLAVTSNPDRTSPVKRGLYILDNILGSPPAPPPPNIPPLEESGKKVGGQSPNPARVAGPAPQATPRAAPCHARMDPLGLALENFNALGRWRDKERTEPDRRLRQADHGRIVQGRPGAEDGSWSLDHRREFYRCLTEKLLTYALGRGLEASDVEAVDAIVERIEERERPAPRH